MLDLDWLVKTTSSGTGGNGCAGFRGGNVPQMQSTSSLTLKLGIPPIDPVEASMRYTPKRILRSGPATIVFWEDGTKTIVKLSEGEEDNAYAAFTAALAIRIFGSNSKLKKMVQTKTEEQK